jgi:hypothetical protein
MARIVEVDFSRPATAREKEQLVRRQARMGAHGLDEHLAGLQTTLLRFRQDRGTLPAKGLRLRRQFNCRTTPIAGDSSDRRAPAREDRPPATKISSGLGTALRLELTAMALVQLHRPSGARAKLSSLGMTIEGSSREPGWADLIAAYPRDSNNAGTFITSRNKRARTVRGALGTLAVAGLVDVAGGPKERNRFENFVLLDEAGVDAVGERQEYSSPKQGESFFTMPADFVMQGWLHVLEDSEIAALLMIANGQHALFDDGYSAFPGSTRLQYYGIHRDAYSTAVKMLDWLGLINLIEVKRHSDGRAEDADLYLHRLSLRPEGFVTPALEKLLDTLNHQIARAR